MFCSGKNQYRGLSATLFLIALAAVILLGGCGGSEDPSASQGQFIDSPVQGVNYQSFSYQGITDAQGNFNFKPGEITTFAIGDVILGTTLGTETITPFHLVPEATDESDPAVINMCRFIQSLDKDGDPANGIEITVEIATELSGRNIDFYQSTEDFNDSEIESLFDALNARGVFSANRPRQLIPPEKAQNHFVKFLGTIDNDSDGYVDAEDCNDVDPDINPGATDIACDGIDQDCSGSDAQDATCTDTDKDGYTADVDCNDSAAGINPGAADIACDGIDQDCSGSDAQDATCTDADKDGYTADVDCNDSDAGINPGAADIACDGIDQDCSGSDALAAACPDADNDSYSSVVDCNDNNPQIYPGANDNNCNGIDNDCDGRTDEDYGARSIICGQGVCRTVSSSSCVNGTIIDSCVPGNPQSTVDSTCDGIDQDCDGKVDEDYNSNTTKCGKGACAAIGSTSCVNASVVDSCTPGRPSSDANCDGVDNDCDGSVDEGYVERLTTCGEGVCASVGATSCVNGEVFDSCKPECINSQAVLVNHTTLNVNVIPSAALNAARALYMSLDHASVGNNIMSGLEDLKASNVTRYSFPNWDWRNRGNPGWQEKVDQFVAWVANHVNDYDVFHMKFCFIDLAAQWIYYRDAMLSLESAYPDKIFIWWTMPLKASDDNNDKRKAFNTQVRNYCKTNGKPLYDIAAIESHDPSGNPVSEGGYEAMYSGYTDDGGHLNASGRLRAAKAMWWLMAKLSGWNP